MKSRSGKYKIMMTIFGIIAVVILYALYVNENGNPLIAKKLEKQTDVYIQQTYPQIRDKFYKKEGPFYLKVEKGENYCIWDEERKQYQFFDSCWVAYYFEKNTQNLYNYIYFVYDKDQNLIYDSCGDRYIKGGNIYQRLSEEYNVHIMKIFDKEYNNEDSIYSLSGDKEYSKNYARGLFENSFDDPVYPAIENSALTQYYNGPVLDINKEYTMVELASEYGKIYFNFDDGINYMPGNGTPPDSSQYQKVVDNLYKRCLEVRAIIEKYDIHFKKITITHQGNEGLINIDYEQLFTEDLYQFIYDNYVIGQ